jgi:glycosyltransferase involved in cell wall biosynthesis
MTGEKSVSVVIPALNEAKGIAKTIASIPKKELEKRGYKVQIVVVDNGSTDNTSSIATQSGAFVVSEPRRGYGRAYKTGFQAATGKIIATADADATYPVEDIPKFIDILENERLDFITTNRFAYMDPGAMHPLNRVGNRGLSLLFRLLYRKRIEDSQSGFWVFRKEILKKLILKSDGMPFSQEIKAEVCSDGFAWKELPIKYGVREGKTKLKIWRDGVGNFAYLIRKRISR